jgi:acetyl-CoA C-acetyltransferase
VSSGEACVIAAGKRTPFGRFGGALRDLSLPTLGSHAVRAALEACGVASSEVEELALGVNLPGSDRSIARQTLLRSGIPEERVAYTCDRACCSSLTAITQAARGIRLGETRVAVAGGSENMSRVPYFVEDMRWGKRLGDVKLLDQLVISCPYSGVPRAVQASREAAEYGIGREEQDAWALRSQMLCGKALADDGFAEEIAPIAVRGRGGERHVTCDESPRPETTLEDLSALATIYGSDSVTAGNAPGLSTGASAVVLMSEREARDRAIRPLCRLVATAMVSGHPDRIASIPARAARVVLEKAGLSLDDIDRIEINEAFAAVPLVSTWLLAGQDRSRAATLREKTNVRGGAIAIGHPTSATAARLVMTLAHELERCGGGTGLVAICGGIGEAEAAIIQVDA